VDGGYDCGVGAHFVGYGGHGRQSAGDDADECCCYVELGEAGEDPAEGQARADDGGGGDDHGQQGCFEGGYDVGSKGGADDGAQEQAAYFSVARSPVAGFAAGQAVESAGEQGADDDAGGDADRLGDQRAGGADGEQGCAFDEG